MDNFLTILMLVKKKYVNLHCIGGIFEPIHSDAPHYEYKDYQT